MKQFRLKKGKKLGALAAESDVILDKVFVDTGYAHDFGDTNEPHFLVLGRTGSGKTALIQFIEGSCERSSRLDPEALSMQYLHSNTMLKTIAQWGVHLDIFFKYLWRHIIILEVIKLRYGGEDKSSIIDKIKNRLFGHSKTQAQALEYLQNHGQEYWVLADTHVKAFTTELENKLSSDGKIKMAINPVLAKGEIGAGGNVSTTSKETVTEEVIAQAQKIVNDYQVAALNNVVDNLSKDGFDDPQKKYFVFIDDLDKNWMPDDEFYLELLKSMLYEVKEINMRLRSVKVVVAMRTNIYYRIFKKAKVTEPQREKWADVRYELRWKPEELSEMIERRLGEVYREQYTTQEPKIYDILPPKKKKHGDDPLDYIIERTFLRPRDMIEYFNLCLEEADYTMPLSWSRINAAEDEYSKRRMNSVIDEWKDSYYGVHLLFAILRRHGREFNMTDIDEEDVLSVLTHSDVMESKWLSEVYDKINTEKWDYRRARMSFVSALFMIGVIGMKMERGGAIKYSYMQSFDERELDEASYETSKVIVHKMFLKSLGIYE